MQFGFLIRARKKILSYTQSLSVNCNLDLWMSDMVLARDASSRQILFKPNNFGILSCKTCSLLCMQ